jgi:hypothetical protein
LAGVAKKKFTGDRGPPEPNAIGYAKHRSRSHPAVIRVYDEAVNVIQMCEHKGEFRESLSGVKIDWISAQPVPLAGV